VVVEGFFFASKTPFMPYSSWHMPKAEEFIQSAENARESLYIRALISFDRMKHSIFQLMDRADIA
jgi:hypothetical protein